MTAIIKKDDNKSWNVKYCMSSHLPDAYVEKIQYYPNKIIDKTDR